VSNGLIINIDWPNAEEPVELADDEAHVWAMPLAVLQPVGEEHWATLAADERDRANSFRFDRPRRRYVIVRSALRRLLGGYVGIAPSEVELTCDRNGKPRLADKHAASSLTFNLSHSGDLALIGFTTGCEVGVDVEQVREVSHLAQIARRFFHPLETDAVLAAPAAASNEAFLRCWTEKEAVLKAIGTGITGLLADFHVPIDESWQGWIELYSRAQEYERSRCWLEHLSPCDGYVAAIAFLESQRRVRCFTSRT
jgi:4'-phosphopantetheinyl transferase